MWWMICITDNIQDDMDSVNNNYMTWMNTCVIFFNIFCKHIKKHC